jgi:hypothetical protein
VPAPAEPWRTPYEAIAREDQLRWTTLDDVTAAAKAFLDPVLAGGLDATWLPTAWRWR